MVEIYLAVVKQKMIREFYLRVYVGRCHLHFSSLLSAFVLAISLLVQPALSENWAYGPIEIYKHYPLDAVHGTWTARSPETVPEREVETRLSFSWGNTYSRKDRYRIDAESRELRLDLDYGVTDAMEIGVSVPLLYRGGGVLDRVIDGWHDFFGLPPGGRDEVPDDEYVISGVTDDGRPFFFDDNGTELGNVLIGGKYLLTPGTKSIPAFALDARVSLPTSSGTFGHDGVDTTFGFIASKGFGDLFLYAGMAWLYYSDPGIDGVGYARHHTEQFFTVEYRISEQWLVQTGVQWTNIAVNNVPEHPSHSLYWDFGAVYRLNPKLAFEAVVREDPSGTRGTIDVDFLLGVKRRW